MRTLGLEFGSTRIKAVLVNEKAEVLATGCYDWENILVDGLWSYKQEEIFKGLKGCYSDLVKNLGEPITKLDSIGISGMMHGYLAFDEKDNLLAPFRTWRNTNTGSAAAELSSLFRFNVPMRWSVSQYYQSVLDRLDHVKKVTFLTTLAGYVHYLLTGKKVIGIGDASGMFPIGDDKKYNGEMIDKFNALLKTKGIEVDFSDILPKILLAGENAGYLTKEGAALLDESGMLEPGCPLCAPEGDMQTGMVCTNCVKPKTANASLGTSANIGIVLEKNLKNYYPEIDIVTTPSGEPAALVHTGTCTSVINDWVGLFGEVAELFGAKVDKGELFTKLFLKSLESDADIGKVVAYNFKAGEPIAKTVKGAPSVVTAEDGKLTLANFMQAQIYSAVATLYLGLEILRKENVEVESVYGHGGYFKTKGVGQNALSALVGAPVTLMDNAGEGGAWGIAILALYLLDNKKPFNEFLGEIFKNTDKSTYMATKEEIDKFGSFISLYKKCLPSEKLLTEIIQ